MFKKNLTGFAIVLSWRGHEHLEDRVKNFIFALRQILINNIKSK
jgi:hypothetical protein